ncbi:MAG: polymer-forming cytoskeletal protein [Bacteroidetes bacterium]|nr:polymer-forming cytoskeletal protein [Bacteroidota bacterium]
MASKNTGYSSDINLINVSTVVEGKITSKGSIRIDGKLTGTLSAEGGLVVGTTGEISGDISAKTLVSGGKLQGKVIIQDRTVLEATSIFTGELFTQKLIIEEGAIFDGQCLMSDSTNKNGHSETKV